MQYMQKYRHKVIYLPFFLFHCRKKSGERGSETWPTEERRVSVKQSSKEPSCISLTLLRLRSLVRFLVFFFYSNNDDLVKQMIQ